MHIVYQQICANYVQKNNQIVGFAIFLLGGEGFATEFITNLYQNKLKYVLGSYMFVHNSKFLHVCLIKCYLADERKEMRHIWAQTKIF